jgi:predicted AAA+ superfamily ATPase
LLKSPKVFWNDTGLAVFLSGYFDIESLGAAREYGAYFETLIYHHLRVLTRLMVPSGRLFFWRRRDGVEVDFVIEHGRKTLGIEVKRARKIGYGDISGLQTFLDEHPGAAGGLMVYAGDEVRRMGKKILAVPWTLLTGQASH